MKKFAAIIVSLMLTCAVATGCGSSDDSSSNSSSSGAASASSAAESAEESSADADNSTSDKTLAEKFTESLSGKSYSLEVSTSSDLTGDMEMAIAVDGDNAYTKMVISGQTIELYMVDGVVYTLDSTSKTYYTSEGAGETISAEDSIGLPEGYKFVSSEKTEDGLTCETYTVSGDAVIAEEEVLDSLAEGAEESAAETEESAAESDSESSSEDSSTTVKYYFDEDGILKKAEMTSDGQTMTIDVTSFTTENVKVELPDLSGWEKMDLSGLMGETGTDSESADVSVSDDSKSAE